MYLITSLLFKCYNTQEPIIFLAHLFFSSAYTFLKMVCLHFSKPTLANDVAAQLRGLWTVTPGAEGHTRLSANKLKTQD